MYTVHMTPEFCAISESLGTGGTLFWFVSEVYVLKVTSHAGTGSELTAALRTDIGLVGGACDNIREET